ncbi:MAG: sigma-70 family RNA polymerase sigma factor [Bacteroidetes bacterium]|nr:sigma-70 family RNA polymerase sigma factor [Bacteroidota bacterium]
MNKSQVSNILQEKVLLEGLAREDRASVEQIYRDNYGMIQSFVLNNNGTTDDAADIFQEAMIVLFEKSKSPDFELNCQLKTYLYSVCRRLWLKRLQQMQRLGRQSDFLEEVVPVDDDIEFHEKRQQDFMIMEAAMGKIGEPCKSLLEAYYIQKKQMQQIAGEFGYTNADNAKTQKYKCLVRLKKLFFAQYKNGQ